jgi:hypothetical protein
MELELIKHVWRRAGDACEYCRMPQALDELTFEIDHVVAESHGGKTAPHNLALSCFNCNRFKGPNLSGIDPRSGRLTRLFNPRRHRWETHFRWQGARLVGRTAVGRTTIRVLHINDWLRVQLREELMAEGVLKLA